MKRSWIAICCLVLSPLASGQKPAALEEATDLSVLYAGDPESARTEAWVSFLEEWFPDVGVIAVGKLNEKTAEAYDVVVADWRARYDEGSYISDQENHGANLPENFSRPVIMIGAMGAEVAPRTAWFTWL